MKKLLLICCMLVSASAAAQVYKCNSNGKIVYSDQKCEGGNRVFGTGMPESQNTFLPTIKREALTSKPSDALANACMEYYRPLLKDPRSAYIQSANFDEITPLQGDNRTTRIEIVLDARAKNSFGAFVPDKFRCPSNKNGDSIDEAKMKLYLISYKSISETSR